MTNDPGRRTNKQKWTASDTYFVFYFERPSVLPKLINNVLCVFYININPPQLVDWSNRSLRQRQVSDYRGRKTVACLTFLYCRAVLSIVDPQVCVYANIDTHFSPIPQTCGLLTHGAKVSCSEQEAFLRDIVTGKRGWGGGGGRRLIQFLFETIALSHSNINSVSFSWLADIL